MSMDNVGFRPSIGGVGRGIDIPPPPPPLEEEISGGNVTSARQAHPGAALESQSGISNLGSATKSSLADESVSGGKSLLQKLFIGLSAALAWVTSLFDEKLDDSKFLGQMRAFENGLISSRSKERPDESQIKEKVAEFMKSGQNQDEAFDSATKAYLPERQSRPATQNSMDEQIANAMRSAHTSHLEKAEKKSQMTEKHLGDPDALAYAAQTASVASSLEEEFANWQW